MIGNIHNIYDCGIIMIRTNHLVVLAKIGIALDMNEILPDILPYFYEYSQLY